MNTVGKYTKKVIYGRDNGVCGYCNKHMNYGSFTLDHIIPKSKGGTNKAYNLCLCCAKCNITKGSQDPDPKFIRTIKSRTHRFFLHTRLVASLNLEGLDKTKKTT